MVRNMAQETGTPSPMFKISRTRNTDKRQRLLSLAVFFMMLIAGFPGLIRAAEDGSISPRNIAELTAKIDSLLREYKIPGAGIALVAKDSIIWVGGVGAANIETGDPVTERTNFQLGSIAKSFVALGVLKQLEEGTIDLQAPVSELVPDIEIDNPWRTTDPVRVVHLLEHTSGFEDIHFKEAYNLTDDPRPPLRDVLQISPATRHVRWKPGTRMAYSNHGPTLAAYILETVTGQRFDDYLYNDIMRPIGMINSSFNLADYDQHSLAQGYIGDYEPFPTIPAYMRPSSSLISSAKEMALFVQFMLNRGSSGNDTLIAANLIDRMELPTTTLAAKAGLDLGYGLGNRPAFRAGVKYYGHGGSVPGFISSYAYIKELGVGCVVLVNGSDAVGFWQIFKTVFHYLVGDYKPQSIPAIKLSAQQLAQHAGYYEYWNNERRIDAPLNLLVAGTTVLLENDTLYQQDFQGTKKALIPVTANTFRRADEPEASVIFLTDDDGDFIMADPINRSEYIRTGAWRPLAYRIALLSAVFLMASSLIYALLWIPLQVYKKLRKKNYRSRYLGLRILPLLAVVSLACAVGGLTSWGQALHLAGQMSFAAVVFYLGTLLFAGFSVMSFIYALRCLRRPVKLPARLFSVILSSACLGMTVYMWYWGLIGMRMWAY